MASVQYIPYHPKRRDLMDETFGSLTVLFYAYTEHGRHLWYCECICGRTKLIQGGHLTSGHTQSCGLRYHLFPGSSQALTRRSYDSMLERCLNDSHPAYKRNYQDRGITVCQRWLDSFEAFLADMTHRPSKNYSIERRDNALGYFPENCYWATRKEQALNRRTNRLYTHNGMTQTLSQWADEAHLAWDTLYLRLKHDWPFEKAISTPSQPKSSKILLTIEDVTQPIRYWVKVGGVHHTTILERIRLGWSAHDAVFRPVRSQHRPTR